MIWHFFLSFPQMNFKRFFSNEPAKQQLLTGYFKDNSATITLLLGVAGGAFTFGLYLNQIKIYESIFYE